MNCGASAQIALELERALNFQAFWVLGVFFWKLGFRAQN